MSRFCSVCGSARSFSACVAASLGLAVMIGCGGDSAESGGSAASDASLTGSITINGSSTVYPISQLVAEDFRDLYPNVKVPVSYSGTSAGMGMFLKKEIDICDASRKIKDSELETADEAGIKVVEFVVGLDGIAITANKQNDWCDVITVDELRAIWRTEAQDTITRWNQVNESWSDVEFMLYGPGQASGTFEYFTEVINGTKKQSRTDYQGNENDDALVRGVAGDKGGLGYFGYAYYATNKGKLKLIAVKNGDSPPVKPSVETIRDGTYAPLSRPIFIYVNKELFSRPEGRAFVKFYVENAGRLAEEALYVPPDEVTDAENKRRLEEALSAASEPSTDVES